MKERCFHPNDLEVLAPLFLCRDFIKAAYEAMSIGDVYNIGIETSPLVTAFSVRTRYLYFFIQSLSPHTDEYLQRRCKPAVSITNNAQWSSFKNSLWDTPKSVVDIRVKIKSSDLIQWKKSAALMVGPNPNSLMMV